MAAISTTSKFLARCTCASCDRLMRMRGSCRSIAARRSRCPASSPSSPAGSWRNGRHPCASRPRSKGCGRSRFATMPVDVVRFQGDIGGVCGRDRPVSRRRRRRTGTGRVRAIAGGDRYVASPRAEMPPRSTRQCRATSCRIRRTRMAIRRASSRQAYRVVEATFQPAATDPRADRDARLRRDVGCRA